MSAVLFNRFSNSTCKARSLRKSLVPVMAQCIAGSSIETAFLADRLYLSTKLALPSLCFRKTSIVYNKYSSNVPSELIYVKKTLCLRQFNVYVTLTLSLRSTWVLDEESLGGSS